MQEMKNIFLVECTINFKYRYIVARHKTPISAEPFRVNIDANGDPLPPKEMTKRGGASVNIDPTGTRSFDATVRMMENVAMEMERKPSATTATAGSNTVVVAALGDALVNTHFYTGSGMSVGKLCVCVCEI
jgi:hypothetical protein